MDLDEALMGPEPDWDAQPEPLRDETEVERLLRRYRSVIDAQDAAHALAATQRAVIDEWLERQDAQFARQLDWLERSIETWARASRDESKRRLSFSLPSGTIATRRAGGTFTVTDTPAFVAWATENDPALLRVPPPKPQPDMAAIDKAFVAYETRRPTASGEHLASESVADSETGEVVPGLFYNPPYVSVTIKLGGD